MIYFDTDYMEGAHPEVMRRLAETNLEHSTGYGTDPYTAHAKELVRRICGDPAFCGTPESSEPAGLDEGTAENPELDVTFLVGGTQTNATVIDALLARHEGVLACETAHINVHEAGAVEHSGHKVLTLPSHDGKVSVEEVRNYIADFYADDTYEHMVAPGLLYITYPSEYGTLYTRYELEQLHEICKDAGIPLFIDGARLGYGMASPASDITFEALPKLCDVFYIGGTKVGALFGECVVARKGLLRNFFPLVKQHGALLAKGRLLGIQFETLFAEGLYLRIARQAVDLALMLKEGFRRAGYEPFIDSPTNQQFFTLPNELIDRLRENFSFENWGPRGKTHTTVRFVTSWATAESDVRTLLSAL